MEYKKCFVPSCDNDSVNSPDKIIVKIREDLRKEWCEAAGVEYFRIYTIYCCEDHFNPGKDLANYYCYKENNTNPKLKSTAKFRYLSKPGPGRATSPERSPSPSSPTSPEKVLRKSLQKAFLQDQPLLSIRKRQKQKITTGSIASRKVKKQATVKTMNDFGKACRCCLLKVGPMKPIFGTSLNVMLTDLMGFQIKPNDGYPQQVCTRCIRKLSSAHNFLLTVNKSHTTVEEILNAAKKPIYVRNNIEALSAVKEVEEKALKTESKAVSCQTEEEFFQKLMLANVQLSRIERASPNESDTDYVMLSETECDTEQSPENQVSKIKSETAKPLPELKYVPSKVQVKKLQPETNNVQVFKVEKNQSPERKFVSKGKESPKLIPEKKSAQATLKQTPEKKYVSKVQKTLKGPEAKYVQVSKVQSNTSKLLPEKMNVEVYESYEDVPDTKYGYKCPQCLHIANSQADLKDHIETHLVVSAEPSEVDCPEETPGQLCNICGQTFKCRTSLYKHLRFHRGQVFECKFCAKKFAESSSLKIHLVRRHSSVANSQPFDCSACDRTFTQKSALAKHVRAMHSLQRAVHQCTLCDKTFLYKYSLNKHCLRNHSSSRCSLCDSQFSGIIALEAHMKRHKENDIFETEYLELDEL